MKKFFLGIKKAWMTLPIKAKKVYKLSAIIVLVGSYYIYTLFAGPGDSLSSSVSIAKNPPSVDAQSAEGELMDYEQAQYLKLREAELAESKRESGESYLPDFKALETETGTKNDFSQKPPESKPEEPPKDNDNGGRNFPAEQRVDRTEESERKQLREEERKLAIEARVAAYSNIVAIVKTPKNAGSLYQHYKPVEANQDKVAANSSKSLANEGGKVLVANRLTVGDTVMAKIDNYVNSDNSSKFVRLTLLEGELESGIVMGEYERVNGVITIVTKTLSKNGVTTPFPGIVVTSDGRMETGLSTDTDYHTFYRWSALIFSGALKGAGEMYLTASDEVITDNGTVIKVNEKDPLDIVMGVAKGVGDVTSDIALKEFSIPPTVIVDPLEIPVVGIMLTADAEAPWFSTEIREFAR
tara:strand:+ start:7731 stop:8966 length:1236 start_codon:yes stop_codon:yes gene_type:complete